jgi:hypothetical protein
VTGSRRRAFSEDRHRRAVVERLVKATLVVEGEPFADARSRFEPVGVAPQIDVLVLERAPEAFDEDVVHPAAAAVHGDANAGVGQHRGEGRSGELAALSVLKISGRPYRASASSKASTQNDASLVFDSRQDSAARLALCFGVQNWL